MHHRGAFLVKLVAGSGFGFTPSAQINRWLTGVFHPPFAGCEPTLLVGSNPPQHTYNKKRTKRCAFR